MKTIRGLLLLDFSIQAVLIGGMLSAGILSSVFFDSNLVEMLWVPYFILGGWQLFFAMTLRYGYGFRGIDGYLQANGIFALVLGGMFALAYIGSVTNTPLVGFFWILVLLLTFVPPIFAISRFVGAYNALDDNLMPYEKTSVS